MKYIDPNGKDILDFIGGIAHSVVSNFTLGTVEHSTDGITDADDYNAGQAVGDGVSIIMGAGQTIVGGGATAGSAATSHGISVMATAVKNLASQGGSQEKRVNPKERSRRKKERKK